MRASVGRRVIAGPKPQMMASSKAIYLKLDDYKYLRATQHEEDLGQLKFEYNAPQNAMPGEGAGVLGTGEVGKPEVVQSLSFLNTFDIGHDISVELSRPANLDFNPIMKLQKLSVPVVRDNRRKKRSLETRRGEWAQDTSGTRM